MARGRQVRRINPAIYRTQYIKPKKQLQWRSIVRPIITVVICLVVFWAIFLSPWFQIHNVKVTGNKTIASADISDQINKIMASSLLGRNSLFLSTDKIAEQLKSQNFQLGSVQINRSFFNALTVAVTEQQPSIGWRSGSSVFVLSTDGKAFAETKQTDLPIVDDRANIPVKLGDKIVPADFITFTQKIIKGFQQQNIGIDSIAVPGESIGELYIQTKNGYYVKLDTNRDPGEQLTDLRSVLASLAAQKKNPSEYIDLRISGKVFYK